MHNIFRLIKMYKDFFMGRTVLLPSNIVPAMAGHFRVLLVIQHNAVNMYYPAKFLMRTPLFLYRKRCLELVKLGAKKTFKKKDLITSITLSLTIAIENRSSSHTKSF